MPRGGPDWGTGAQRTVAGVSADPGEIAARLGSPVTYSRTGTVIWLDTFEFGFGGWTRVTTGTGGAIALITDPVHSGRFAVKLTGGSTGSGLAQITKYVYALDPNSLGVEVTFQINTTDLKELLIEFTQGGPDAVDFGIFFDGTAGEIYYLNSASAKVLLDTYGFGMGSNQPFYVMKLVVDLVTRKFVRLHWNERTYDMAGISGYLYTETDEPYFKSRIEVRSLAGSNEAVIVDNVIFTANEP